MSSRETIIKDIINKTQISIEKILGVELNNICKEGLEKINYLITFKLIFTGKPFICKSSIISFNLLKK